MEVILEEFKDCCMVDQIPKPNSFINLECSYYLTLPIKFHLIFMLLLWEMSNISCIDPDRGTGGQDHPPSLKNYIAVGFLSNTGSDLL